MKIAIRLDNDWSYASCAYHLTCPDLHWYAFTTMEQAKEVAEQIITELEILLKTDYVAFPVVMNDYANQLFDKALILCETEFARLQSDKNPGIFVEISTTWIKPNIFCLSFPDYLCAVHEYDAEYDAIIAKDNSAVDIKRNSLVRNNGFAKAKLVAESLISAFEGIFQNMKPDKELQKWR